MSKLSLLIIVFLIYNNINAQCNLDDYKALRALYYATNGDNWKNKTNWDIKSENPPPNCNLSKFFGVYLNEFGRIYLISLGQNNLEGQIPVEIKNLTSLNTLWLEQNKLYGTIQKELGNLVKLERLAISYNKLNGTIPNELFNLQNLKELSIESNLLTGSLNGDFKKLPKLERLLLNNNNFFGYLPTEIGLLLNLKEISFHNNNFEGCFPNSYKSLCSKNPNFSNNLELANWSLFCNQSICQFDNQLKEVSFNIDTLFNSQSLNRKNLIFISEGFKKDELQKFREFVIKITSKLKIHFPNISFDAVLANVPSNDSGVGNSNASPSIKKDTYFETDLTQNANGQPSVFIKDKVALPFVKRYFPETKYPLSNRIFVYIVNSDIYGAYAAAVEGVSSNYYIGIEQNIGTSQDAEWVFAHELGHIFGLADINDTNYTKQEWPNITQEKERSKIKWRSFINDSTPIPTPRNSIYDNQIGLFPIIDSKTGKESGWYKPCNNKCIMDSPGGHFQFCKVCSNHFNRNDNLPYLKVENGNYGGYFYAGNKVGLKAISPDNKLIFSHWEGTGITFDNILNPNATMIMPNRDITIKAIYKSPILSNEKESLPKYLLFPNPNNGTFELSISKDSEGVQATIFDLAGKIIYTNILTNNKSIIELNVINGAYLLKLSSKTINQTLKLIVQGN